MSRNTTRHARKVAAVVGVVAATAFAPLASTAGAAPASMSSPVSSAAAGSAPTTAWRQVSAGDLHTCAVTRAGAVKCWGNNTFGQLGDGTFVGRRTPVQVVGLESGVRGVASGAVHSCALTTAGAVKCWGTNWWGMLGNGSSVNQSTRPVQVRGLESGAQWVATGRYHACAVTARGALKCWGDNSWGQLGVGPGLERRTPTQVRGLTRGVTQVSAGGLHTCAALVSGAAMCWGDNDYGQLGDGTRESRKVPVAVKTLSSGVARIRAGYTHTCAVLKVGSAKCWGNNYHGQVGDGSDADYRSIPAQVTGAESGVIAIAAGLSHSCLATTDRRVRCFGYGSVGQLGYGGRADKRTPVTVKGLQSNASPATSAGRLHSCAVATGGILKCWGHNLSGQLGDGTTQERRTPVDVRG